MPLSADEVASAKQAQKQIKDFELAKGTIILSCIGAGFPFFLVIAFLFSGVPVIEHGQELKGCSCVAAFAGEMSHLPFLMFLVIGISQLWQYHRLAPRHKSNLETIAEIERQHPGEFPYGLLSELDGPRFTPPRRPLLWRIDALFSRKPVAK